MKRLVLAFGVLVSVANAEIGKFVLECNAEGNEQACKSLIDSGVIGEAYECDKKGMCFLGGSANLIIGNKDRAIPYLEKLISLNDSQRKQDIMFITMTSLGINEKDALQLQEGAYIDLLEYYIAKNKSLGGNKPEMFEKIMMLSYTACGKTTKKQVLSYACSFAAGFLQVAEKYHDAFAYAKKGCETNVKREEAHNADVSQTSCWFVGELYEEGKGVRQDYAKAAEYYKKGCDLGYAMPCEALGSLYMKGKGVPRNRSSAKRLFGKACDFGSQEACNKYRELSQAGVQ